MSIIKTIVQAVQEYRRNAKSNLIHSSQTELETIKIWQANFFADILIVLVPLSVLIYIPSLIMSLHEDLIVLAVVDTIGFLVVQYIFFSKKLTLETRKIILLINLYLLGLALLYFLGWSGPGLVYLLGFSTFSVLILSNKAGYTSLTLNIIIFIFLALLSFYNLVNNELLSNLTPAAIITIGLNFIILNLVLVISITSLIRGLQVKIESEKEVQRKLEIEMEEHKQAKLRAEESDRLKSVFLANMSHEIRTPINGILGFAQLLKEPHLTGDKQQEFLRIIDDSDHCMLNIINNIIDISKIEAGQMEVYNTRFNLNELLDSIFSFFKLEAEKLGIHLTCQKPIPNVQAYVESDAEKIYAIMLNLIKNSIKYSNSETIEFGYEKKSNSIKFFVKDSGVGIPMEKQLVIFERFVQADYSTTKEGTGLGLAISKAYVDLLGGDIWVDSQIYKGASFYFTVPCL